MKNRLQAGFTLAEVMVASTILMIFTLAFLGALITSMKSQQLACDYYKAMTIARNRIQRAKTFEYTSLSLMNEIQMPVDGDGNITTTGLYERTTLVSVYTNGTPNLYKVTVQVYYPGARRAMSVQPVEISTLLTEKM